MSAKTNLSPDLLDRLGKIVDETTTEVEKLDPDCTTVENFWSTLQDLGWAVDRAKELARKSDRTKESVHEPVAE